MKLEMVEIEINKLELSPGDVLEVRILDEYVAPVDMDRVDKHLRAILPEGVVPLVYNKNQIEIKESQFPSGQLIMDPTKLTTEELLDELIGATSDWGYYAAKHLDIATIRASKRKELYRIDFMKRLAAQEEKDEGCPRDENGKDTNQI